MTRNIFIRIITSLPIILIALFFLPVLGILLLILRFITATSKSYSTPSLFIILGLLIQVPNLLNKLSSTFKFNVPYLDKVIDHELYLSLTKYSILLIIVGVVLIILTTLFTKLFSGIKNTVQDALSEYVSDQVEQDREIDKENDLEMKIKQEKAKNFHVVTCPHCGATNQVTVKVAKCKYCRQDLEVKE